MEAGVPGRRLPAALQVRLVGCDLWGVDQIWVVSFLGQRMRLCSKTKANEALRLVE